MIHSTQRVNIRCNMMRSMGRILTLLLLLSCGNALSAPTAVSFYRLRIDYSTTSDWTTLDIESAANILTLRLMSVKGAPTNADARADRLALNQPLSAAQAGGEVGITVDYALAPEALDQPLNFLLKKGAYKGSVVRFYHEAQLIREISHQVTVQGDTATNALRFSLDLSALKKTPPRQFQLAGLPKMVWAFYYPWYYANSWSSAQLKDHPLKPYASDDPKAIARQIDEAQSAGIDGFISSWWGPGHYTDKNLKILLELARARDFYVTIYFETLKDGGGRSRDEIFNWLSYAISTYRYYPAFMKVNGKPLIVVWASNSVPLATWDEVFTSLRAQGLDATYLAMGRNVANLSVFDGLHEYGVFTIPDLAQAFALASRATRYYPLLADSPAPKIWASTAQPGYDDRLIPGRAGAFQDRQDGAFYRGTLDAALASQPDWIFITTWNEWWEHTHIEPSELYGDQYLRITREYADRWKGPPRINSGGVVNAASYAAGPVAPGEIVTLFGSGLGPSATRVLFDGLAAPLVYASDTQVSAVVPYGVAGKSTTQVAVERQGARSDAVSLPLAECAPGIFTLDSSGKGQAAILNQDNTVNSASNPAPRGSIVMLFATGEGQTDPPGVDGKPAADPLPKPLLPVSVTIGGLSAHVLYAGGAPGLIAGVLQVNARIPESVATGAAVSVSLTVGQATSQAGVTLAVR